jgi:hypothetical protein
MEMTTLNCAIVGPSVRGKKEIVKKLISGKHENDVSATSVMHMDFDTPVSMVEVVLHESPSPQESFDMVYIFYDIASVESADSVSRYVNIYRDVPNKCVIGTEMDMLGKTKVCIYHHLGETQRA